MRKSKLLRFLSAGIVLCLFATLAHAQSQTVKTVGNQTPQATTQKEVKLTPDQQKSLDIEQGIFDQQHQKQLAQAKAAGYLLDIPGFTYTGDKVVDDANYAAAKQAWIQDDPVAYKQAVQAILDNQ